MTNLSHNSFLYICVFQFSTCFEQPSAHHQETQLYQYDLWFMSLCVGDRVVCRFGWNIQTCIPRGHLHIREVVLIQFTLLMVSTWLFETCRELEHTNLRKRNCGSSWSFTKIIYFLSTKFYEVCRVDFLKPSGNNAFLSLFFDLISLDNIT